MQTQTLTKPTITIDTWIDALQAQYNRYKRAGWDFIFLLRDGIDALPRNDHERAKLYQDINNQLNLAVHTLQNYVSAARKPYATLAQELDLEIGHLDAVLGLADDVAEDVLKLAAEQAWSVSLTRKEAWTRKSTPDIGKQAVSDVERFLSSDEPRELSDGEPAYTDNAMYASDFDIPWNADARISIPREPLQAAAVLRAEFSEGEIATLIDALLR